MPASGRANALAFRYLKPAGRRATQYEELTLHTQWSPKTFATQGWFSPDSKGRGVWDESSTRLKASDWWGYRDPSQQWFRPYVELQTKSEQAIELAIRGARRAGLFAGLSRGWARILADYYSAYRFPEYGIFLALCYAQREALSDVVGTPLVFQSLDKVRHSQAIALCMMELEEMIPGFTDQRARPVWMEDPVYQPSREYVELLLACRDWGEILVAINLAYEPLVAGLITREFFVRGAAHNGDPVTPVILETVAADRERNMAASIELVRFLIADTAANRGVVQDWLSVWEPRALRAAQAFAPLFDVPERKPIGFDQAAATVAGEYADMIRNLKLQTPTVG